MDLLTLLNAKAAIRLPASDTSRDDDLTNVYIPAVTSKCEEVAGPIGVADMTVTMDVSHQTIQLPSAFNAITSITSEAGAITGFTPIPAVGIIRDVIADGPVTVVYTAGYATVIGDVLAEHILAARIILAHLWQADQQGQRGTGQPGEQISPIGFVLPRRAEELLRIKPNVPGFA